MQVFYTVGIFFLFFVGWWLPALIYYGVGLWWLVAARRKPWRAIAWVFSFVALASYAIYEGVYVRWQMNKRAEANRDLVLVNAPPENIKAILVSREPAFPIVTGNGQNCAVYCLKLLLGKHFKTYIIAVKDGMLFSYDEEHRRQALRRAAPIESYRGYTVVDEPGCENAKDAEPREVLDAWRLFGRCVKLYSAKNLRGRFFEVTQDNDIPDAPPWPVKATHIRAIDLETTRDIAHVESARVFLAFWFPVPGVFPHKFSDHFPTAWWPDLLRFEHKYGREMNQSDVIAKVFNIVLEQRVPMPNFDEQTPDGKLKLASQIMFYGPMRDRLDFITKTLAAQRPLDQSYSATILNFISRTKLSGHTYAQLIPYIAWLGAGDASLAPVIADHYIDRAANDPNGAAYARALSYFSREILEPRATRLVALYNRVFPNQNDADRFRESVNFGVGNGGPALVDKLISELENPSSQGRVSASAAAALCRAADPRALEPLQKKLAAAQSPQYVVSYAYALARLGHGEEAKSAVRGVAGSCLNEIVAKYPSERAPDSICILSGPYHQPADAAWQLSESEQKCLAPRTPSPNG